MMIRFSAYPQRMSSMPPWEPRFVMPGMSSYLVDLMITAIMARMPRLIRMIRLILIRRRRFRFQKITVGKTARKRSAAALTAISFS